MLYLCRFNNISLNLHNIDFVSCADKSGIEYGYNSSVLGDTEFYGKKFIDDYIIVPEVRVDWVHNDCGNILERANRNNRDILKLRLSGNKFNKSEDVFLVDGVAEYHRVRNCNHTRIDRLRAILYDRGVVSSLTLRFLDNKIFWQSDNIADLTFPVNCGIMETNGKYPRIYYSVDWYYDIDESHKVRLRDVFESI